MANFIYNSTNTKAVRREFVRAVELDGLTIILKMEMGADIRYDTASDESDLNSKLAALKSDLES